MKISMGKYLGLALVVSSTVFAQSKSLGDIAREQQAAHSQQKKATSVHSDVGDGAGAAESSNDATQNSAAKPAVQDAKGAKAVAKTSAQSGTQSVLDRPLGEKPDPYVVPAGTEIRVDLTESKISVPVRLGFATPIPALTKVAVVMDRTYLQNNSTTYPTDSYVEYATITAITIHGKTYEIRTNRVQVSGGGMTASANGGTTMGSSRDAVFILSAPVEIER